MHKSPYYLHNTIILRTTHFREAACPFHALEKILGLKSFINIDHSLDLVS